MDDIPKFMENHNTMTLATHGKNGAGAAAVFYTTIKKSASLLTPKGQSVLDNTAFDVKKKLEKEMS